jgi:hypothetical protein
MPYSPFFQTLHDETQPVGHFGRGTHYSVLRVPIWQDEWLNPLRQAALLDFAVIWDEDHDERVIEVIKTLYFGGLLAPVRFIGERKGSLSVLIDAKTVEAWDRASLKNYREAVSDVSQSQEDPWPATVDTVSGPNRSIIHAPDEHVSLYLRNIELLWKLGRHSSLVHLQEARRQRSAPPPEQQARILQQIEDEDIPF